MRPLSRLPFRNRKSFETDDIDVAYEFLKSKDRDVADMRANEGQFRFKSSSILLPHISVFSSSSDPLTIRNRTSKDDVLLGLMLSGQANAVAEQSSSQWNAQQPALYQFYEGEHRYDFETERLVVFVSLAAEQYKATFQAMYPDAKPTLGSDCPSGHYLPDTAGISSQNTTLLMAVLALTNSPDADDDHLGRIGSDEVLRRLFVEMVHSSLYRRDELRMRKSGKRSLHALDIVCEEIIAHPHKPITLTMMEQMTGMSSRSLRNAFYERFNCSPQEWQRNHKLDLAHDALSSGDTAITIKEIARQYGFLSAHSFTKFYQRRFGKRPSSMRGGRR